MSEGVTQMRPVDHAWLRMDTDVNLMMIVGVWLLTPAIRLEDLRERVATRLLRYERFRQKAVQDVVGARWVPDDDFDLARHIVVEKLARKRGHEPAQVGLGTARALGVEEDRVQPDMHGPGW